MIKTSLKEELQLYKLEEISNDFDLHVETLRRYIRAGMLNAKKVGKFYFVHKADIVNLFSPEPKNKEK